MAGPLPPVDPSSAFPGFDTSSLNCWMECRDQGSRGMQANLNVVSTRARLLHTTMDAQVVREGQFSWTNPNDPQHSRRPGDNFCGKADMDAWAEAQRLTALAKLMQLPDITGKATLYYNPNGIYGTAEHPLQRFILPSGRVINFPGRWRVRSVIYTVNIGSHYFFREV